MAFQDDVSADDNAGAVDHSLRTLVGMAHPGDGSLVESLAMKTSFTKLECFGLGFVTTLLLFITYLGSLNAPAFVRQVQLEVLSQEQERLRTLNDQLFEQYQDVVRRLPPLPVPEHQKWTRRRWWLK